MTNENQLWCSLCHRRRLAFSSYFSFTFLIISQLIIPHFMYMYFHLLHSFIYCFISWLRLSVGHAPLAINMNKHKKKHLELLHGFKPQVRNYSQSEYTYVTHPWQICNDNNALNKLELLLSLLMNGLPYIWMEYTYVGLSHRLFARTRWY